MTEPLPLIRSPHSASTPVFERIAIVGLGLIGGSLALAVKRASPGVLLIGVDRNATIERATVAGAIDVGADDLGMVSEAELIVLAAPVDENIRILERLAALVPRQALVTDVGSTKRMISAAAAALPPRLTFIGGHPMAGAAAAGFDHARADLFDGRPWILTSGASEHQAKVVDLLTSIGARCSVMSPEEHDRVVAYLSDLPQLTASALMHVVGEALGEDRLTLAGGGLRDTTRLAGSPAKLWKPVAASNADEIQPALDALIDVLLQLKADIARGEILERVFQSAQKWKASLSADR